jgi:hypothetical protein
MNCTKCGKQIDDDSKFCIHCGYSQIEQLSDSKGSIEPFMENGLWGFKDKDSRDIVIPPKYTDAGFFKENRAVVGLNGKYSIIDNKGKELTPFKYDFISGYENGFAKVRRDGKWTYLNFDCKELTAFKFDNLEPFENGLAKVERNNNYAIINQNGEQISEFYESIFDFIDSIAKVKRNQKFGLINGLGKEILSCEYDSIGIFSNGLAKISEEGKVGLIDISGKIILTREYDNIDPFTNGIAKICKSDNYGFINSSGKIIISCKYERAIVLGDDSIAAKLDNIWTCFNKEGIDVTETNNEFRSFRKRKRRKKYFIWFTLGLIFLIVLAGYDYNTNMIGVVKKIQTIIFGEDEMDWRYAKNNLTISGISSIETYLGLHPNGLYVNDARNIIEENEWKVAKILDTQDSYKTYVRKYPSGKFVPNALNKLEQINWEEAIKSDLRANYENYLLNFPDGLHKNEAKDYLAWGNAKGLDIIQSYQDYLTNYPDGKNMQMAIEAILIKCKCETCNGTGICHRCNGTGIFGQTQKLEYDPCPNLNKLFHGKHCKLCGGSGIIKRFSLVDAQCDECNGSGKCNICMGLGKIQNEWLNTWYAMKINCQNCSGSGYISEGIYSTKKPCPVCNLIIN